MEAPVAKALDPVPVKKRGGRRVRLVMGFVLAVACAVSFFGFYHLVGFRSFYIPSSSMEPTLMGPAPGSDVGALSASDSSTADRVRVERLFSTFRAPRRHEIWVFKAPPNASPDEKEFIKRVIGLPGETVTVAPSQLRVDGMDGPCALLLTAESGGVDAASEALAALKLSGPGTDVSLASSEAKLRVIAAPQPQVSADQYEVRLNGRSVLKDEAGFIESRTLDQFGAEKGVEGTLFMINGEPRLAVVKGKSLAYVPGHVTINGARLDEPHILDPAAYAYGPP